MYITMITLKSVRINDFYDYFICPCVFTMDLFDEILSIDLSAKFYSFTAINQHNTGVHRLDSLSETAKKDISDFYINAGMSDEEAGPDSLDAIYTKLDTFDLCEASKQFFGNTMDPDYKHLLRERMRLEDKILHKLQLRKAG